MPSGLTCSRDHEQVLAGDEVAADADLVGDLLLGRVRVLARLDGAEVVAAALDVEHRPDLGRIRRLALLERPVRQPVVADGERLAAGEPPLADRVVRARAGDADREQDDRRRGRRSRRSGAGCGRRAPRRRRATSRPRARGAPACRGRTRARSTPSTKAENVYAIRPGIDEPAPSASSTAPVASATPAGQANVRRGCAATRAARRRAGRSPSAAAAAARRRAGRSCSSRAPTIRVSPTTASCRIG